jgi:hypothetical protein
VLVCLHGYYDYLGRYTFNPRTRQLDDTWSAYDRHGTELPMSRAELHRRIGLVKGLGFRCALYFCDSLAYDDAIPEFDPAWTCRDADGNAAHWYYWQKRPGCERHKNYLLDPGHPDVRQWFLDYTRALVREYGSDVDAFVWDETFFENPVSEAARETLGPSMECRARAMMRLVADVTCEVQRGWSSNPGLALLVSDNIRRQNRHAPFCLVAHGTFQDSACHPDTWAFGRLTNFRNCLISCNWYPVTRRERNRLAAELYDRPQGVSNGWGDDRGPSEMPGDILDEIVERFVRAPARQARSND